MNYMFKVNNRNIRASCEICSKLTIKTPERRQWHRKDTDNERVHSDKKLLGNSKCF